MSADINDLFTEGSNGSRAVATSLTASRNIGDDSITVGALTGWPTATAVHFCIYSKDSSGKKIAGSQTDWKGIASGTSISDLVLKAGVDTGDPIGAIVEAAPTAAWVDDLMEGLLNEHLQSGQHGDITPTSVTTPQVNTDTISEKTTNAGVTVDGMLIKDGSPGANTVIKSSLEKPHYNCLFFSVDSGTVFTNSEVTVPFDVSDTVNGYGITATTGANALLTIARDGFYDIQFRFTCIDNAASDFIAWIFINDTSSVYGIRRQDQSIGVNQGDTYELKSVFLPAGSTVYAQHYNGGGATRFGTNNVGGSSSAAIRRLYESLTVMEVR